MNNLPKQKDMKICSIREAVAETQNKGSSREIESSRNVLQNVKS